MPSRLIKEFNIEDVIFIEKQLSKVMYKEEDNVIEKTYNKFTKSEMKKRFNFDLDIFSNTIGFKQVGFVIVENPKHFQFVLNLMKIFLAVL